MEFYEFTWFCFPCFYTASRWFINKTICYDWITFLSQNLEEYESEQKKTMLEQENHLFLDRIHNIINTNLPQLEKFIQRNNVFHSKWCKKNV